MLRGAESEVLIGSERILYKISKIAVDCTAERFEKTTSAEVKEILNSFDFHTFVSNKHIVYAWKD